MIKNTLCIQYIMKSLFADYLLTEEEEIEHIEHAQHVNCAECSEVFGTDYDYRSEDDKESPKEVVAILPMDD